MPAYDDYFFDPPAPREIFGNPSRVGYSGAGCAQSRVRVVGRPAFDVERAEIIWELKSRLINKD